ncbi:adenylate/guanylate cyclase domain-containing protein [Microvirga brassicacearum]|uniref:Adenylate/guanylate cyclase domain-containing protein n=1 Tax=Microvirga brassicacearum TaxID=2580413 RepID=A0A5N3PJ74_9HYPH|nr:adenylate/guanylate cyclase domain-containing protein [Microvirga brassicacearum]KAB0269791.1 adenylate/guanylate cyclase domain-containing protein [Microvirga brassicacearum]
MRLPSALAWLVDAASTVPGADNFLATLGAQLIADGLPLAGGALTLAVPHPVIARRAWLWRAETGAVIEAFGFGSLGAAESEQENVGRDWLVGLGTGMVVVESVAGSAPDSLTSSGPAPNSPVLGWAVWRSLTEAETVLLHQAARFAAAPLAVLAARSTLAALLEAYLGRRSAAQVLAGRLRRGTGETIRAVLLYGDLRGFTALSEAVAPEAVVAALDAWFERIAGAVQAFGGEVLKFTGDGVLAIFPVGQRGPSDACEAALRSVSAARAGMAHLDQARSRQRLPPLPFGMALHLGDMLWGNIGTADRLDFTAIGPAVNLVCRLEGLCRPLGRSVLISGAVAAETTTALIPLGEHVLRGIATPCAVFTLPDEAVAPVGVQVPD